MPQAFFYGSYMDPDVLRRFGAEPGPMVPAVLRGWRLTFTPHANITRDDGLVRGFLCEMSQRALDRLYGPDGFVTTYEPVEVDVVVGKERRPATTFVEEAPEQPVEAEYLGSYLAICRKLGLPEDYVEAIEGEAARLAA